MTERPIGSTFDDPKYGKIQVVEGGNNCEGCVYADMLRRSVVCNMVLTGYCHEGFRSDHKNVIFKKIGGKMTEHPIGSVFEHPNLGTLKVEEVKGKHCKGCAFLPFAELLNCPDVISGFCHENYRSDKKGVIFKKIGGTK